MWSALFLMASLSSQPSRTIVPQETRQLVVGIADDWHSRTAVVRRFERGPRGRWHQVGKPWQANLGKDGLAVGRGLVEFDVPSDIPRKLEGDHRAPAGIFPIGRSYGFGDGYRPQLHGKMTELTDMMACIEDPVSSHYNDIVETASLTPDWTWLRILKKPDGIMSRIVVIGHNGGHDPAHVKPDLNAGSCILFHVSRGPDHPTFGCTSLPAECMDAFIAWLDPLKKPAYILLPASLYRARSRNRSSGLPRIP